MATITKRRGNWFAQVRRKGHEPLYQTFKAKADAQAWAREQEAIIDKGGIATSTSILRNTTLGELVDRYVRVVTPQKRGASAERYRLNKMRQSNVCLTTLSDLSTSKLASYRDYRLTEVTPATVKREISLIHRILEVARLDWGIPIQRNPAADVRVKKADRARDRRLCPRSGQYGFVIISVLSDCSTILQFPTHSETAPTGLETVGYQHYFSELSMWSHGGLLKRWMGLTRDTTVTQS